MKDRRWIGRFLHLHQVVKLYELSPVVSYKKGFKVERIIPVYTLYLRDDLVLLPFIMKYPKRRPLNAS